MSDQDAIERFLNQRSPMLDRLRALSVDWERRFVKANGQQPDAVLYPLMAMTSDIRYAEILVLGSPDVDLALREQRAATRRRWDARREFAKRGLKWVAP